MKPIKAELKAFLVELRKPNALMECKLLSLSSMTKVCIITDVGKLLRLENLPSITTEQFDILYDCTLDELENFGSSLQGQLAFAKSNHIPVRGLSVEKLIKH